MRILDRYIGTAIAGSILMVATILIAVFTFFEFIDELDAIGKGNYRLRDMLEFSLLRAPSLAYEILPIAALVGSLIGLGNLVFNRELIAMRAAGVSLPQIIGSVMKASTIVVVIAVIIGEFISPYTEQLALQRRAFARYDQITFKANHGLWIRDGKNFINIRSILPDDVLGEIFIYEFDDDNRLRVSTYAKKAKFSGQHWMLDDIQQTTFEHDRVKSHKLDRARWRSPLRPGLVNMVTIEPENLSMWDLGKYIRYLDSNGQNTRRYQQAFWFKVIYPLAAAVMVFLSLPILLTTLKNIGIGPRIVIGSVVGLVFHITNQVAGHVGVVHQLPPALIIPLPTVLTLVAAFALMHRIR